jgi:hypothetical protein
MGTIAVGAWVPAPPRAVVGPAAAAPTARSTACAQRQVVLEIEPALMHSRVSLRYRTAGNSTVGGSRRAKMEQNRTSAAAGGEDTVRERNHATDVARMRSLAQRRPERRIGGDHFVRDPVAAESRREISLTVRS